MTGAWLQDYLAEAIEKQLCTQIACTTCGAMEFRLGLLDGLGRRLSRDGKLASDRESAMEIARALSTVFPPDGNLAGHEGAVRCILFDLWSGMPVLDQQIEELLAGSWAGDVLQGMKAHHAALEARRAAGRALQDPANVELRRAERKRQRAERHRERLRLKAERDRNWRASNGKTD